MWARYPKKAGKDRAQKAYLKARKDGTAADDVDAGLLRYLAYVQAQRDNGFSDLKYKDGGTWFCQRGWMDEYVLTDDGQSGDWMAAMPK